VGDTVEPVFFVKLRFPAGDVNMVTAYGDILWDSETWAGTGLMLGIDRIEETADLVASGISITLSGVSSTARSLALNAGTNIEGGTASIWLALMDRPDDGSAPEVIGDPYKWDFRMDTMSMSDTATTTTIKLDCESVLIDLERPRIRHYTPDDQAIDYAGDTFFNWVAALQDKTIQWGKS
jgi:hypothetical protein